MVGFFQGNPLFGCRCLTNSPLWAAYCDFLWVAPKGGQRESTDWPMLGFPHFQSIPTPSAQSPSPANPWSLKARINSDGTDRANGLPSPCGTSNGDQTVAMSMDLQGQAKQDIDPVRPDRSFRVFRNQFKGQPTFPAQKGMSAALAYPPVPKGLLGLSSSDRAGQAVRPMRRAIHASAPLSVVIVVRDVHWCRVVAMLPLCYNGLPGTKFSKFRLRRVAALDYFGRKWQPGALAMALSIQGTQHGFQQSTTHIGQTGKYPRARLPERFAVCTKQEDTWRS